MDAWRLPVTLEVAGINYAIRTDFRDVLTILEAMGDPDLETGDKWYVCLSILFIDYDSIPREAMEEAAQKAKEFIDIGIPESKVKQPSVMDWTQDAPLIIPAVNKVLGTEVRAVEYMHWWTFLSAYMEIGECSYSHIIGLRTKKAKGKPLEKWEQEFLNENAHLVNVTQRLSEEEIEEEKRLEELFG